MESISRTREGYETFPNVPAAAGQEAWDDTLAHWVSQIGSPPATALAAVVAFATAASGRSVWFWASLYVFTAILMPTLYVVYLYTRGLIGDIHMNVREERTRPCVAAIACSVAGLLLLCLGGGPALLVLLAGVNVLQTGLFLVVTRWWKISLHGTSAGALAAGCWLLADWISFPLMLSLPLIAWSRIHLHRHTVAQVVCGVSLGAGLLAAALLLAGPV
jgi:hypothetical protein